MLKANFINGFLTGGYALFIFTGCYAEFMKGGMLMKSKHIVTYGKEIAFAVLIIIAILIIFTIKVQ